MFFMTPEVTRKIILTICLLFYFLHQPYLNKPSNKKIRAHVKSNNLPRNFKIAPTTLSTIAGNVLTALPASQVF